MHQPGPVANLRCPAVRSISNAYWPDPGLTPKKQTSSLPQNRQVIERDSGFPAVNSDRPMIPGRGTAGLAA